MNQLSLDVKVSFALPCFLFRMLIQKEPFQRLEAFRIADGGALSIENRSPLRVKFAYGPFPDRERRPGLGPNVQQRHPGP